MARISIIGSGVVGTIIGTGFKKLGNEVTFYDVSEKRAKELRDLGFEATINLAQAVQKSDVSFICVPTPTKDGKIDLSYIRSATENLARYLKEKMIITSWLLRVR